MDSFFDPVREQILLECVTASNMDVHDREKRKSKTAWISLGNYAVAFLIPEDMHLLENFERLFQPG